MLLLLMGTLLCGGAVALAARAVALPRLRMVERVGEIQAYGLPSIAAVPEKSPGRLTEALDRLAERLGSAMLPRLSGGEAEEVRTLLMSAGMYATAPGKFLGYRALSAILLPAGWLWLGSGAGFATVLFLLLIPLTAAAGWVLPLTLLRHRAASRLDRIDYELPELIDSLVVTVEAGMGFGGALRMAARKLPGPLGAEINLTLHEQSMGLSTQEALENLLKRADTASMRSFVRSVLQAETLGVSIGDIMRGLAIEMRSRRKARAEERAQKAPVKMLFPLVFCIFPAIMIILLYPAAKSFTQAFGG